MKAYRGWRIETLRRTDGRYYLAHAPRGFKQVHATTQRELRQRVNAVIAADVHNLTGTRSKA